MTTQQTIKAYADRAISIIDKNPHQDIVPYVWGNMVIWWSKKQHVVARSSVEVEYRVMANGVCEMLWPERILEELWMPVNMPIKLYCDNKAVINIAHNPVQHDHCTKHVEIDKHFKKEKDW